MDFFAVCHNSKVSGAIMERSLLLAQYDTAAQQARAVVEECCDDDGEHALVKERALYILVQALCLDTR